MLAPKIDASLQIIRDFLEVSRNPYLSCSFSKDSLVMLWLVRKAMPGIPVVWFDGGKFDEFPETKEFAGRLRDEWNLNLTTIYPEIPLLEQWKAHGIPDARFTKEEDAYNKQFAGAFRREIERCGYDGNLVGMRAQESKYRRVVFAARGHTYFHKGESIWRCCPLWNWQIFEIWHLIDREKLPYHPVYDQTGLQKREEIRLGVLAETSFYRHGSLQHMKLYYPGLFNELCAMFPEVRSYV